jgi:DNA polymerase-3 subunit epsilon
MATAKKAQVSEKAIQMNELLLRSTRFVVGDIETTTFSPEKGGRIIEVAGVKIENGKIIDRFSQLIDPQLKIPPKITEITNITNEMVKGMPVFGQVLPDFYQFIGDAVFVAHNAMFDWDRFLTFYFKKVGIIAKNPVICTKVLAKMYFPYWEKHDLKAICLGAGVNLENHHRALDDSDVLAQVLLQWKQLEAPRYDTGSVYVPPQLEVVEQDLFSEPAPNLVLVEETKPEEVPLTFKIKRVSYWEKDVTKQKKMQRIYMLLSLGNVYFDIPSKTWYNKDVQVSLDFDEVQRRVLGYLKLSSLDELCNYRSQK